MILKEKTACFTGHREIRENPDVLYAKVCCVLESLIKQGYLYFGAGGARGFDTLAAQAVLKLKEIYPQIHLILVLPFPNQYEKERGWEKDEIKKYRCLKEKASKVIYIQDRYGKGCYYKRNRHLVDFSSVCICYQYKNTGGTAYTVQYADKNNLKLLNLYSGRSN